MASRESAVPSVISSRSFFDLPPDFFESCRLILDPREIPASQCGADVLHSETPVKEEAGVLATAGSAIVDRLAISWTCHTCRREFDSLQDQRLHFKSDLHRLNVKLQISGRNFINEEDFDEIDWASLSNNFDVSSISGSEEESENVSVSRINTSGHEKDLSKQKLYVRLRSGGVISLWKCLILDHSEDIACGKLESNSMNNVTFAPNEDELIRRLKCFVHEPRDKTRLRTVLLTCGGHFAGCVFDGNSVVAHKTFHRYVVRAKAGQRQSAKDATGRAASSAGSSLRRYNEAALKKDIHELLVSWKPYFDASSCIFIYAPSKNHNLLFEGDKLPTGTLGPTIHHIPVTVRRPTFKEAQRIYRLLTHVADEQIEEKTKKEKSAMNLEIPVSEEFEKRPAFLETDLQAAAKSEITLSKKETEKIRQRPINPETPGSEEFEENPPFLETELHEAAKSGDVERTLELLKRGFDPCVRDSRGKTPYMLASEKEVRNTFRRFMASNPDKWDWHAANVPGPLTKEMEESQAAKQAEKDAKRKAKAKEMKKLRKEKERARAEKAAQRSATAAAATAAISLPSTKPPLSIEMQLQSTLANRREKMAAAAEARITAMKATPAGGAAAGGVCCRCGTSLAGVVPFHRYHYSYCSSTCMHLHRELLEKS